MSKQRVNIYNQDLDGIENDIFIIPMWGVWDIRKSKDEYMAYLYCASLNGGLKNCSEIGTVLNISRNYVASTLKSVLKKLGKMDNMKELYCD
jgi:hypothetical protein